MKIDIISGFLGAGKTTFIRRLLNSKLKNEKVVLIENEFGEVSVDTDFLADTNIDVKELSQGCICCSLFGDFSKSLKEVVEKFNPDCILIEPSGVGKLSDIIQAVVDSGLQEHLNALVCLVDVNKAKMYTKNFGEFFLDQIKSAHTIVLSRTDIAKEEKAKEALEIIRENNHDAVIVTTPVSLLADEELFKAYEGIHDDLLHDLLEEHHHHHDEECGCEHHHHHDEECGCEHHHHHDEECGCEHHHHHDEECGCEHHHHHHADEIFMSIGFETLKKYDIPSLKSTLDSMANGEYGLVVRAKGIVSDEANQWYEFNLTPEEVSIVKCNARPIGKICVIGSKLDEHKIKDLF
ncbi:MAG: GTP-binding protein [Anaeroplasmataceae bacterium]|nr:GTP-binding protein [Anaeroplasmataceae bacterium]